VVDATRAWAGVPDPVDWALATRVARELVTPGDRGPTPEEERRLGDALRLAELWLDTSSLPAPPDAGRIAVVDRATWVEGAVVALRPLVDPIARAAGEALVRMAGEQADEIGRLLDDAGADALPDGFDPLAALGTIDPSALGFDEATAERMRREFEAFLARGTDGPDGLAGLLRHALDAMRGPDAAALLAPGAAMLAGLQAGQVVGRLAQQAFGQYDLGVPAGPRRLASLVAVNVDDAFAGYGLDPTEVALTIATTEAAHRRLFHAVGWLEGHLATLVGRFAAAATIDTDALRRMAEELAAGFDPDDPEALATAMERAATLRLEPNTEQRRVLAQLQGVVALVGAWARAEAAAVLTDRLPSLAAIEEVLRRRRATRGDGEELLAGLLGLDLAPDDESVGDRFVAAVTAAVGSSGLRAALAHPENLPTLDELADPGRWLARTVDVADVPDDPSAFLAGLGSTEAPREATAAEREAAGGDARGGGDDDPPPASQEPPEPPGAAE
jgi:putative hydrolase